MPLAHRRLAPRLFVPTLRWLRAVVVLAVLGVATFASSARVSGETGAVLQSQGTRAIAMVLLATPLVLAASRRNRVRSGNA